MKYFSIEELTASSEARTHRIDNTPPPAVKVNLANLINRLLDPIRELWGAPIIVNSGFRSHTLNKMVGGVSNSQHLTGEAADITAGSPTKNKELFEMIVSSSLKFDQLIDEDNYRWLHVSFGQTNRNEIKHL